MKDKQSLQRFKKWQEKFMPYGVNIMEQEPDHFTLSVPEYSNAGLCGGKLFNKAAAELAAFDKREINGVIVIGQTWTDDDMLNKRNDFKQAAKALDELEREIDLLDWLKAVFDLEEQEHGKSDEGEDFGTPDEGIDESADYYGRKFILLRMR